LGGLGGLAGRGGAGGLEAIFGSLLANDGGQGGIGGLVSKFERAGMGDVIGSWIGKGDNKPVSEGQLGNVLGGDVVSGLAQKLGINAGMLLPLLASVLPMLIDKLTPQGQVPAQGLGNLDQLTGGASPRDAMSGVPGQGTANSENELLASLSNLLQKR
jgi:uncharacterized protein YidB (DUF937 family)